MEFESKLIKGILVERYKRFMADVILDNNQRITAHCPNTGAMLGLSTPGLEVWVSRAKNAKRKLSYTLELVNDGTGLVGVNTHSANKIVYEAINNNKIDSLRGYKEIKREVVSGESSRIDIVLESPNLQSCFVEVKSVTMCNKNLALFPDSVTARGAKHLRELSNQVQIGNRAVIFYLVQRDICDAFEVAGDIDAQYEEELTSAFKVGVEVLCYRCKISTEEIVVGPSLPTRFNVC